ncbi:MAG: ABC transporter substrate-binding protein, partial [Synechococcaceae cyanobacterium SM2_3_2]|nr:ABC transporter substrate-binding protein [Synechococcaceae cyanobacterium SM2_3_2]
GNWQDNFRLYAEALGHSDEAEKQLQDYQDQVQQLSNLIGSPSALQVSVITQSGDSLGSYTTGSFAGAVLQDVGLARNPAQVQSDRFAIQLSQERLDTIDGDLLFLIHTYHLADSVSQSDFVADPLWSQLAVVQQGGVCEVNGAVWIAGRGILAAQQILRDVEKCWRQVAQNQTE